MTFLHWEKYQWRMIQKGKGKTESAKAIYEKLSDSEKKSIDKDTLKLYNDALDAYKEGRVFRSGDAYYKVLPSGNVSYNKPVDKASIVNITVPNSVLKGGFRFSVVKISVGAFKNCKKLEWVIIGKNVANIGKYAFKNTPKLQSIKIQSKKYKQGTVENAFSGAGKNSGKNLIVKVPKGYVQSYNKLFKGEGKLNKNASVIKA